MLPASRLWSRRALCTRPMYANQHVLPRLPLPTLEGTLRRYLEAAKPLVPPPQYEATASLVQEAREALSSLQSSLEATESAKSEPSYVAAAWDDMYLCGRWPLPLNSNPGWASESTAFPPTATSQVQRAARLIAAMTKVALEVEGGTLSPDVFKKTIPVDMNQYAKMFASMRIPRRGRDELHKAAPTSPMVSFIAVLRGADFWKVPVLDAAGAPLSVAALEASLDVVCNSSPSAVSAPSLAALTTMDRDAWADSRASLSAHHPTNAASLAALDDALFHCCLDLGPAVDHDTDAAVRLALCGHPTSAPRWFDKGITVMVSSDGVPMGQFEHSWGDGMYVLRPLRGCHLLLLPHAAVPPPKSLRIFPPHICRSPPPATGRALR